MGQGAHHLGTSPAPAPHNVLLGQGIGASSLPAPPLVTTRAVPGVLAQRPGSIACAAQGCGTRPVEGSARHMGHGSVRTGERCRQSQCRGLDTHGAMPGRLAPDREDAAATHNLSQRNFRLNPRPGRARRLSKAARHWAPIARQRATRKERHSGLAWPTDCDKPKRAPPVMDGMVRTVTHGDRRCHAENESLHRTFIMTNARNPLSAVVAPLFECVIRAMTGRRESTCNSTVSRHSDSIPLSTGSSFQTERLVSSKALGLRYTDICLPAGRNCASRLASWSDNDFSQTRISVMKATVAGESGRLFKYKKP